MKFLPKLTSLISLKFFTHLAAHVLHPAHSYPLFCHSRGSFWIQRNNQHSNWWRWTTFTFAHMKLKGFLKQPLKFSIPGIQCNRFHVLLTLVSPKMGSETMHLFKFHFIIDCRSFGNLKTFDVWGTRAAKEELFAIYFSFAFWLAFDSVHDVKCKLYIQKIRMFVLCSPPLFCFHSLTQVILSISKTHSITRNPLSKWCLAYSRMTNGKHRHGEKVEI